MIKRRPLDSEFEGFFKRYIDKINEEDICHKLEVQLNEYITFYGSLTEEQWNYRYEPGKWSIKDVLLHIIDTERVFDTTALPGFDQNEFAKNANASSRSSRSLIEEYNIVRQSTLLLFQNMADENCIKIGTASDLLITPIALSYMIAGHDKHHMDILKERYI